MRSSFLILIAVSSLAIAGCGKKEDDKLSDDQVATANGVGGKVAPPASRCQSVGITDALKRELFRRAAEVRGSNADNYARIAEFALLQVDGAAPVVTGSTGASTDCRGHATLRLPAGLHAAGGRTTLEGDIGYSVAAGTGNVVTLGEADAITVPLATLTQARASAAPAAPAPAAPPVAAPAPPQAIPPVPSEAPTPVGTARPSFDCNRARTRGELAVCASPSLAALDRTMSGQYRSALIEADPDQAQLLRQTRDRFLSFRDRCPSDGCIANTYRGRMREIDDIMAGRWISPR